MRKYQLHLCAFVLLVSFQLSFDLTAAASPWLSSSLSASLSSGSTSLLTTAKTRCEKVFVCDYAYGVEIPSHRTTAQAFSM